MLNKSANDKILKDSKVFTVIKKQPKNQCEIRQKDCITILNNKAIVHEYELGSRIDQEINIIKIANLLLIKYSQKMTIIQKYINILFLH